MRGRRATCGGAGGPSAGQADPLSLQQECLLLHAERAQCVLSGMLSGSQSSQEAGERSQKRAVLHCPPPCQAHLLACCRSRRRYDLRYSSSSFSMGPVDPLGKALALALTGLPKPNKRLLSFVCVFKIHNVLEGTVPIFWRNAERTTRLVGIKEQGITVRLICVPHKKDEQERFGIAWDPSGRGASFKTGMRLGALFFAHALFAQQCSVLTGLELVADPLVNNGNAKRAYSQPAVA